MRDRKLLNIELNRISPEEYKNSPKSGIIVLLDNIRSAHNIGSIFRTCDSFKIDKIFLCGICATPPSAEIHKSALGAERGLGIHKRCYKQDKYAKSGRIQNSKH